MAFCGFATAQQADKCVERFHKTYCRTSRLVVELALAPAAQKQKQKQSDTDKIKAAFISTKMVDGKATTKDAAVAVADDAAKLQKKEQFLATLNAGTTSTTRRKFWANDDEDIGAAAAAAAVPDAALQDHIETDSESSVDSGSDSDSDDDDSVVDPIEKQNSAAAKAPQSDMDFLRSKQVETEDLSTFAVTADIEAMDTAETNEQESKATLAAEEKQMHASEKEQNDAEQEEQQQKDDQEEEEEVVAPNRLFCRNLPFSCTDDDLRTCFSKFGTVLECHVPVDDTGRSKGFGFVTFSQSSNAASALTALDGTDFQGRLLHILPARRAPTTSDSNNGGEPVGTSYKDQQEAKRREAAATTTTGWSASFVRGDAVVDNLAARLGLRKGDILAVKDGLSSGDAAVRLALGETAVIEENRTYFAQHGVDMEALVSLGNPSDGGNDKKKNILRSKTFLLVKNLPHDTNKEDLMKVFATSGKTPSDILLPPSKTIAVVKYSIANDAKVAFKRLAYRRFKSVPLYLEWAPLAAQVGADTSSSSTPAASTETPNVPKEAKETPANEEEDEVDEAMAAGPTSTLYVKNLSFATTEEQLRFVFSKHASDVRNIRIPQKVAPLKRVRKSAGDAEVHSVSMGYGFVEFDSQESVRKVLKALQGTMVDGHALELKLSNKGQESERESSLIKSGKNSTKVMVRNVPFQATRTELLKLFGSFGQLKKVRLPKKFDGSHRGFAFVEYLTGKEAAAAMKSLSRTHLYGRHLVLEWAANDEDTDDLQTLRDKAQRDQETLAPKNKKIKF
jgi:multiple RNA-binding domain-containing protein 1